MNLYATTLNHEPAFVFAESIDSAIAKFNRLRRLLCVSPRLGLVRLADEVNHHRTQKAHQAQVLLGEPLFQPKGNFQEAEERLRMMFAAL
jgi:hypothetical protein